MRHFLFQVIYNKNQKTIAMIQSHHRILSLDSSHCVTWFIELFFYCSTPKREGIKNSAEFFMSIGGVFDITSDS